MCVSLCNTSVHVCNMYVCSMQYMCVTFMCVVCGACVWHMWPMCMCVVCLRYTCVTYVYVTYAYVCDVCNIFVYMLAMSKRPEQHQASLHTFLHPSFWDEISHWVWVTSWLDWMASEPQGSLCLCPSPSELGLQSCASLASLWLPGIQTQVSVLL